MAQITAILKPKAPKAKKPSSKPSHPPTSSLVNGAIRALKERHGSSVQAIKKYIATENKVDTDKLAPFIRRYLRKAIANGKLVQVKGHGASGSFKLPAKASPAKKKPASKKPKSKKSVKKASKPKAAKKSAVKKPKAPKPKRAAPKKAVTAKKSK